jgi:hypothetical protein
MLALDRTHYGQQTQNYTIACQPPRPHSDATDFGNKPSSRNAAPNMLGAPIACSKGPSLSNLDRLLSIIHAL